MTDKEEIDFSLNWIDENEESIGFLPANFLAFAKDFMKAQNESQEEAKPCVSMRDLYGELREMGLSPDNCDKVIEWSKTL